MNEESRTEQSELVPLSTRRGLLTKAGLMGLGVLGMGSALERLVTGASTEGPQSFLHVVQRPGTPPGGPSSPRKRRTVNELLTILQRHPGGSQAIEAARRGGAKFSLGIKPTQPPKLQGNPPVTFFSFSVVLVPGQLQVGNSWARFYSVDILTNSVIKLSGMGKSSAVFQIDFPKNGWYLLNIEGLQISVGPLKVELKTKEAGGPTLQTWSYPVVPGTSEQKPIPRSFPAMFEYTGGAKSAHLYVNNASFAFLQFSAENL